MTNNSEGSLFLIKAYSMLPEASQPSFEKCSYFLAAARKGDFETAQALVESGEISSGIITRALYWATRNNHPELALYLAKQEGVKAANDAYRALDEAAKKGHVELLQCLAQQKGDNLASALNFALCLAMANGQLEAVQYLLSLEGVELTEANAYMLFENGGISDFSIVRYLLESGNLKADTTKTVLSSIAELEGHTDLVRYLNPDESASSRLFLEAAGSGDLTTLQKMVASAELDPSLYNDAFRLAVRSGRLAVVKYLADLNEVNVAVDNNYAIRWAAKKGHLELVQYLAELEEVNPNENNNEAFDSAVEKGHLDVIQYLESLEGFNTTENYQDAFTSAASGGNLELAQYFVSKEGVNPAVVNNLAFRYAASSGHLEVVQYLAGLESVNPAEIYHGKGALDGAAEGCHFDVVHYLIQDGRVSKLLPNFVRFSHEKGYSSRCGGFETLAFLKKATDLLELIKQDKLDDFKKTIDLGISPAIDNNCAISLATKLNRNEFVRYLLTFDSVDPAARNSEALSNAIFRDNEEIIRLLIRDGRVSISNFSRNFSSLKNAWAFLDGARDGHLDTVQKIVASGEVSPILENNYALRLAASHGRTEVVRYLLTLDKVDPTAENNYAIRYAAANGHLEVVRLLLEDARVRVTPNDISQARTNGYHEIATLLEAQLSRTPLGQVQSLIAARESVLSHENQRGISGAESSMDAYLERQAERQREKLIEKYQGSDVASGLSHLRELVFKALQSHLEKSADASQAKLSFLNEHMALLVSGESALLAKAAALFDSNEDIYEIASRAVNGQAPFVTWSNLLTTEGETGEWIQNYAGNIAREITASEGKSYYEDCLYALIYRLSEIRRAHNEGNLVGVDNPSCFPGTKTRLLKVLESHPEHSQYVRPEWKTACYEGAARHIEQVFGQVLNEMDSREEAEHLYDALLMMRLENAVAIERGRPLLTINGDRKAYDEADCERRLGFIERIRQGLQESVNAYLCEHDLEPILEDEAKVVYLHFLEKALGETWAASRLSAVYSQQAPKADPSKEIEMTAVQPILSLRMLGIQQRQALQALKKRFYEYCEEKYPEVELSSEQVNRFFRGKSIPKADQEQVFFDACLKQISEHVIAPSPLSTSRSRMCN